MKFGVASSPTAVRNICGNRSGGAPGLARKSKSLVCREVSRCLISLQCQLMGQVPHFQITKVLHSRVSLSQKYSVVKSCDSICRRPNAECRMPSGSKPKKSNQLNL